MVPVCVGFTEVNVQTNNQGCYIVGSGAKHGLLKETKALQKQMEMLEKQRSVVNLATQVAQATEMTKSAVKREREVAESRTFVPPCRRQKRLQNDHSGLLVTQRFR